MTFPAGLMLQRWFSLVILSAWVASARSQEPAVPPPPLPAPPVPFANGTYPSTSGIPASAEEAEHCEHIEHGPQRWWARGEYLLWYIKDADSPALVTTGAATDTRPGALGNASTRVLFGGANIETDIRSGGRFQAGWWADDAHHFGIEAGYFFLGSRALTFSGTAAGRSVLARPYFDALNNQQDSSLIAYPGLATGSITITGASFLDGAEVNGVAAICHGEHWRFTALVGLRYLNLEEDFNIQERTSVSVTSPRFAGSTIAVSDIFDTENYFYGGQLGIKTEFEHKRFALDVVAKIAFGTTHEVVRNRGFTSIDNAAVANAGFLVLSTNTGEFTRDRFAVVPEVGVNLGYQVTHGIKAYIGYSFLYWSRVARPGDQIDPALNPNLIPTSATFGAGGGPARPMPLVEWTDFWTQGVSFGMEFRY